jgi:dGTPase
MDDWIARRSHSKPVGKTRFNAGTTDSHYQRDRARVIHSAWFRALQSKTQVLGLGESDFYRTRLTHSLEVAQIGSGICEHLKAKEATHTELQEWIAPSGLIDAACLAHDIGHSPFGHGGEVALNYKMRDHGGFEANGQTLRILSRLGEYSEHDGLDLTRRATLSTVKYPGFCTELAHYTPAALAQEDAFNLDQWHPPKGIYVEERDVLEWILQPFSDADRQLFVQTYTQDNGGHRKTRFKSFDTSMMELADDIAYGVHDLEDAIAMSLLSPGQWASGFLDPLASIPGNPITANHDFYTNSLFSGSNKGRKHAISKLVGWFINHTELIELSEFEHPLLRLQASLQPEARDTLKLLKKFVMDEVIMRPELQALQYRGQQVILKIFDTYQHNPERLLPTQVYLESRQNDNPHRIICDYISALTDASATRIFHRFSTPSAGSIFDRI